MKQGQKTKPTLLGLLPLDPVRHEVAQIVVTINNNKEVKPN